MSVKVAINGYGRIGRNILRALYESGRTDQISIVAINDLGDAETNAHLTRHDTAHGRFPGDVSVQEGDLVVNGDRIRVCAERDNGRCGKKHRELAHVGSPRFLTGLNQP